VLPGAITPGGKPVIAVPGLTPMSPEMTEAPVLVTVLDANTAKDPAVPKGIGGWAADADCTPMTPPNVKSAAAINSESVVASQKRTEPTTRPKRFTM
jgi:hypothetical protein